MHIARVQVEEGFLDGLDLELTAGLNTIIGARGTGKTSLIELIRFCLDVQGFTPESQQRSYDHARSILDGGQVTVSIAHGDKIINVSRTGSDETSRKSDNFSKPIIFSQTEIESIGLQARGRLKLIDGFLGDIGGIIAEERLAISEVRSLTEQIDDLGIHIDNLTEQVSNLVEIKKQIAELEPEERKLEVTTGQTAQKKQKLDQLSLQLSNLSVSISAIERFYEKLEHFQETFSMDVGLLHSFEEWPSDAGEDPLVDAKKHLNIAFDLISKSRNAFDASSSETEKTLRKKIDHRLEIEAEERKFRMEIEALQTGAGEITRRGQQLRSQVAQLESLGGILNHNKKVLKQNIGSREKAFDRLDNVRQQKFTARQSIAEKLNNVLGPEIKISVLQAAQHEIYIAALQDVLRGSGIKYKDLSLKIAASMSPRELLETTDNNDFQLLADVVGISTDRAARLLANFREAELASIATVAIEDGIDLKLLDGKDYKDIEDLSTGQRCTVILPIVLRHIERILIVDQPEDHIDNAFVTSTLLKSILARDPNSQIIFSTHNANIPVLGEADRVIQLSSDGHRGFIEHADILDNDNIVDAITTLMEGGADAFQQRASFYVSHQTK